MLILFSLPNSVIAGCSPYIGKATLNEFFKENSNQTTHANDLAEVRLLDTSINLAIYGDWKIKVCENPTGNNNSGQGCSALIPLSSFTTQVTTSPPNPWTVLRDGSIGDHINMKEEFDAILIDGNGDLIDYFTLGNYTKAWDDISACALSNLSYDYFFSSSGASAKSLHRNPDGIGDWGKTTSGSDNGTTDDTNDTAPDGPAPIVSVNDVAVFKGDTAAFTFTLSGAPKSYDVTIDYVTQGGTAVAGTDYSSTSGTATISAGQSTTSVNVSTIAASPSGITYFNLYLSNPTNSTILNAYPTGTILADASAEWYMDEASWSNASNEVSDSSSNSNHGTPNNGPNTTKNFKVLCSAGSFDGTNDYIEIPHHSSLVGSDKLTYSAWIRPDTWSGSIRQIMSKSVHGGGSGRAQMGIFSENGNFVGRAETAAGRFEVYTPLPPLSVRWIHVALTFNGTSLIIYIDGVVGDNATATKKSITTFNSTTLVSNSDPLMISKRVGSNQYYFDGYIDEVVVLQAAPPASFIKLMNSNYLAGKNWDGKARSCPSTLHHIEIVHDASALTCNPETLTVRACTNTDVNATCSPAASPTTVPLTATGTPITWLGGSTKSFTGSTTYSLQKTSVGPTTLGINTTTPSSANSTPTCKNSSGTVISCDLTFNDSGFIFDVATQTSCVTSSNIKISAVRKSPTTEQCIPFFDGKAAPLKFWATYASPSSGTKKATLNYNTVDYPMDSLISDAGTDITVTFDSSGEANFTLNYADAGQLDLKATYTGSVASSDDGLSMSGNKLYVTKPAKFYVYSDDTNASCVSGDPTNANCNPVFRKTGENFNLKVRAACDDNSVTPNFQLNGMSITSNLIAPSSLGSINANLNVTSFNFSAADNGEHVISTQHVDQVGIFTFTAALPTAGNYLGEAVIGTSPLNTSANIGRFTPDHFDTLVTHGCSGGGNFTYSGQPFTVTATARNQNNLNIVNYREGFAGVTLSDAAPTATPLGMFTNNAIPAANFTSTGTGSGSQTNVVYTFTNKETIPETLEIRATDLNKTAATTDDINSNGFTEGVTEIRSGRSRVENSYGSELVDMAITAHVEYYNTNGFEINTTDTCSAVTATLADIGTDPITVGDGSGSTQTCIRDDDAESGTDSCSDASVLPGPIASQFESPAITGNFNLFLKTPGANNTGDISITLNSPTWLKYDWDGDGTHDNDPTGIASFGLYRGDDRIIYWREVF